MRCLAVANEAKRRDWECIFVLRDPEDGIVKYINSLLIEHVNDINGMVLYGQNIDH